MKDFSKIEFETLSDHDLNTAVKDAEINLYLAEQGQPGLGVEWERATINALQGLFGNYVMRSAVTIQELKKQISDLKLELQKKTEDNQAFQEMKSELERIRRIGLIQTQEWTVRDLWCKSLMERKKTDSAKTAKPWKLFK